MGGGDENKSFIKFDLRDELLLQKVLHAPQLHPINSTQQLNLVFKRIYSLSRFIVSHKDSTVKLRVIVYNDQLKNLLWPSWLLAIIKALPSFAPF